jgi:hypothetical protein
MRSALLLFLMSVLATFSAAYAQGTGSPAASPRQQPAAPAAHRQPRAADLPSTGGSTADSNASTDNNPNRVNTLEDERLNRILNGICRGC